MIRKKIYLMLWLCSFCLLSQATSFTSPNGKLQLFWTADQLVVSYRADAQWQPLFSMPCAMQGNPTDNGVHQVDYQMITGKRSHCINAYQEVKLLLQDGEKLLFRLYNDGIAWHGCDGKTVDMTAAKHHWLQRWTEAYEEFFPKDRDTREGNRWAYPALFEFDKEIFLLLSESNIDAECAASCLYSTAQDKVYRIAKEGKGKQGWQTAFIGRLADIVESTLVTDNSAPCKLADTSWIEPGVASWVYWAYNHGSNDFKIIKRYVDMAVKLKLPYVLIDAEWDEMKDGKTIEDAVKYAVDCGVKPMIWYNSSVGWIHGAPGPKFRLNKPEDCEREFAWCESIGVKGVKIDFFSGDNNLNIRYMTDLLECAARHHLLVNFHGSTIPRGFQRTYPNLISVEAVYGEEWYNNLPVLTRKAAAHNATLPFTRNVIGPMDYTPCAFSDSQHPHITSHAHELALTALYESGIQHLADRPESFLAQPQEVQDYLSQLPTAWDETRLLSGYPGEEVVMARRKGTTWYVAGINGTDRCRTIEVDWSQLRLKDNHQTIVFEDSGHPSSPWKISTDVLLPKGGSTCFNCLPRGGFVAVIHCR